MRHCNVGEYRATKAVNRRVHGVCLRILMKGFLQNQETTVFNQDTQARATTFFDMSMNTIRWTIRNYNKPKTNIKIQNPLSCVKLPRAYKLQTPQPQLPTSENYHSSSSSSSSSDSKSK